MHIPLFLFGVAVIGVSLWTRNAQAKNLLDPEEQMPEAKPVYLQPPVGFRRAAQSDVTPSMTETAKASLSQPMGSLLGPYVNEKGLSYYVAIETHSNKPKGASIFIQA